MEPAVFPFGAPAGGGPSALAIGGRHTLAAIEEAHIEAVLKTCETQDDAAEILGVDPSTLWRRKQRGATSSRKR